MGDSYRNGKVHVQAEMCSTCIFRPGNLMHLEPGRVQSMVGEANREGGAIDCHSTLYGQQEHTAICRGYFDRHAQNNVTLRLAVAMDMIETDG